MFRALPVILSFALLAMGCGGDEALVDQRIDGCDVDNGGCAQICSDLDEGVECACDDGYALDTDGVTCVNVDECADEPCLNGGTCTDSDASFTCECAEGFEGDDCGTNIDECADEPCLNGGTCTDGVASYACDCAEGFTGDDCATNVDDCVDEPCLNGGTCTDSVASFTCECAEDFEGDDCATNVDDCADEPCLNGGTCTDGVASYACDCAEGFEGDDCATNVDDCADEPCLNGGTCTDGVASYACVCAEGFEGDNCATNVDDCADEPCLNGGSCIDDVATYTCECVDGFEGDDCGTDIDDCADAPCLNGGTCVDGVATYTCECTEGFEGEDCGLNTDDCADAPCLNGGTCVDGVASYTCECAEGFGGEDCAECTDLVMVKTGPVKTIPTAGVRMVFSVETCDGLPVPDLLEQGSLEIINDETGKPFGSEGDAAPSIGEAKDFAFYTVVVLDLSYSVVNNGSLVSEIDGAISLVEQLVEQPEDARQKHNVALYAFGSTSQSELLQGFTKDHDLLYQQLDALKSHPGKGSTNLYGAYMTGLGLVETQGLGEEKVLRSMVLMTDGTHETGDADELEAEALSALGQTSVDVYTIGLAGDYEEEKLQVLASAPENFLLAEEASALVEAFGDIAAAVDAWAKSNYVIGVCSPVEGPDRSLTLNATYGLKTGTLSADYDATGFDLTGCDPAYVSDPCGNVECGVMEGIACSSCEGELVCIDNACADKLCVPGAVFCDGQVITECDGEGASKAVLDACDPSSHFCEEGEQDAWCSLHVCPPNTAMCDGDTRYVCDAIGSGPLADSQTNCADQDKVCFDGACADLCLQQSVEACCSTDDECGEGESCSEGTCVADCTPATECDASIVCGEVDDGCGGTVNCGVCGEGESCSEGTCVACQTYEGDYIISSQGDLEELQAMCHLTGSLRVESSSLIALSLPSLKTIGLPGGDSTEGYLIVEGNGALTHLSLPALTTIHGDLDVDGNPLLEGLVLPALETVGGNKADLFIRNNAALATISAPLLQSVGGDFEIANNVALTTLSLPSLTNSGSVSVDAFAVYANPKLAQCIVDGLFAQIAAGLAGGPALSCWDGAPCEGSTNNTECTCDEVDGVLQPSCE
jgi:hypothetical protein